MGPIRWSVFHWHAFLAKCNLTLQPIEPIDTNQNMSHIKQYNSSQERIFPNFKFKIQVRLKLIRQIAFSSTCHFINFDSLSNDILSVKQFNSLSTSHFNSLKVYQPDILTV
jgi:hypothetical protein